MSLRKKTGGRNFQPGVSGNPNGRPKESPTVKAVLNANNQEFFELTNKYLNSSVNVLKEAVENTEQSYMSWAVSNYLYHSIKKKDFKSFEKLLDRFVGKAPTFNEIKIVQEQYQKETEKENSLGEISPEKLERILEILEEEE